MEFVGTVMYYPIKNECLCRYPCYRFGLLFALLAVDDQHNVHERLVFHKTTSIMQ